LSTISLTILMATRNGAQTLGRVLEAYRAAARSAAGWKLVVVDNGSTDGTLPLLKSFQSGLPLEILSVPEPGKNRALNAAIGSVEGNLAVLTDDDAIPADGFVAAWSKCRDEQTGYGLFGGSIEPLFDIEAPRWLGQHPHGAAMLFGERALGEGAIGWDAIHGGNMAVRREVFDAGFRFDEALGPNGSDPFYPMGSESEFCRRVAQAGYQCWSAPAAKVFHIVRDYQLLPPYWALRARRSGRGRAFMLATDSSGSMQPPPFAKSRWNGTREAFRDGLKMMSPFPVHRFEALCSRNFREGFFEEWRV
jgi:GT2 family glycosyltransferase